MKSLILLASIIVHVSGHGRLMDPPARNAMWRFGYSTPINYNDNELWCGGFTTQHDQNGGKCGVCGDNYADEQPRQHETGGEFGLGIIGAEYTMGQEIDIKIDLSANHWGHFELKICPVKGKKEVAKQECMDAHPLYLADNPESYKYVIPKDTPKIAEINYRVKLPAGITCNRCVVQWTYVTGNTWGHCGNGTSAVGCGDQETFRNCADVSIRSSSFGQRPPSFLDRPENVIYFRDDDAPNGRRPLIVRSQVCVPRGLYRLTPSMDSWCQENCQSYPPACNHNICKCLGTCRGIGELEGIEGTDVWCNRQCLRYPSTCPEDKCQCSEERSASTFVSDVSDNANQSLDSLPDDIIVEE